MLAPDMERRVYAFGSAPLPCEHNLMTALIGGHALDAQISMIASNSEGARQQHVHALHMLPSTRTSMQPTKPCGKGGRGNY